MASSNPYQQYQTSQVKTAGPAQLTLMCYDGTIRFLNQGREAMVARKYDAQNASIDRAQSLINELLKGLDFERGGEVARNLDMMYRYIYDRLSHANLKDDVSALDEVKGHLTELRDAWAEAMNQAGANRGAVEPSRREFALSV